MHGWMEGEEALFKPQIFDPTSPVDIVAAASNSKVNTSRETDKDLSIRLRYY